MSYIRNDSIRPGSALETKRHSRYGRCRWLEIARRWTIHRSYKFCHATSLRAVTGHSPPPDTCPQKPPSRTSAGRSGLVRVPRFESRRGKLCLSRRPLRYAALECVLTAVPRSTQPCIPLGSLNRVQAAAGVKAGVPPLSGGR